MEPVIGRCFLGRRAIAEAHHGRLEIESELGVGSTFSIVVPVDRPEVSGEGQAG